MLREWRTVYTGCTALSILMGPCLNTVAFKTSMRLYIYIYYYIYSNVAWAVLMWVTYGVGGMHCVVDLDGPLLEHGGLEGLAARAAVLHKVCQPRRHLLRILQLQSAQSPIQCQHQSSISVVVIIKCAVLYLIWVYKLVYQLVYTNRAILQVPYLSAVR